jgi:hypothetical protein
VSFSRPVHQRRERHGHDRCVVQECRQRQHRRHDAQQGGLGGSHAAEQALGDARQQAGFDQSGCDDEQCADRDDALVCEAGQRFLRRDDARQRQHGQPAHEDDVDDVRVADQPVHEQREHAQRDDGRPVHAVRLSARCVLR